MPKTRIKHYNGLVNLITRRFHNSEGFGIMDSSARSDVITKYKKVKEMYPKRVQWCKGRYRWIYNEQLLEYVLHTDFDIFCIGYELLKSEGVIKDVQKKYDVLIDRIKANIKLTRYRTKDIDWNHNMLLSQLWKVEQHGIKFPHMLERPEYQWLKNEGLKEYLRCSDFDIFMIGVELLKRNKVL